tara:strand:- start:708 stop:992 length:285 start_codon:yes stop_codon:yes gene_type:complete
MANNKHNRNQTAGKRRKHKRKHHTRKHKGHKRRHRKGGSALAALKTALVPFLLFKAQKHMQKRTRKGGNKNKHNKTQHGGRKRRRRGGSSCGKH